MRLSFLTIFILVVLSLHSQNLAIVVGDIKDDFLGTPLPDAMMEVFDADSAKVADINVMKIMNGDGTIALSQFMANLESGKSYILHASLDGYDDVWLPFEIADDASGVTEIGTVKLHKQIKKNLDEVVVTATKVKMVWKGDTLVYNADAFNLPQGSMLDDLIRQMPGVTMNDNGEIFVNGRKVDELLLGSKSFFRGKSEVLLKNLPYYTVKNIKVYDKRSDLSENLGFDAERKKYVMDVNLKQEYNSGMIANAEAAGGTSGRYLGRAFLLGFSDPFRFSVVGNLNNVNESRHIGQSDNWTPEKMPKSMLTTRSVAGKLKYDNKKVEETLNIEYASSSDATDMLRLQDFFIAGSSLQNSLQSRIRDNNRAVALHNYFKLTKPWIVADLQYRHRTFSSRSFSGTDQYDADTLTNSLTDQGVGSGRSWEFKGYVSSHLLVNSVRKSYFNYHLEYNRSLESSEGNREYDFMVPKGTPLYNLNRYLSSTSAGQIWLTYFTNIFGDVTFAVDEQVDLSSTRKRDFLYHPDTLLLPSQSEALAAITDLANSYDSRLNKSQYRTILQLYRIAYLKPTELMPYPIDYKAWEVSLAVTPMRQSLWYHRGELDTNVRNTALLVSPYVRFMIYPNGRYDKSIDFSARSSVTPPSLYDLVDYRDDSQPLVVKLGNPDLEGNRITTASANFYSRGAYGRIFHIGASFDYMHRATAQSVEYSPGTGVYTYRPVNVKGNYQAKLNVDFTRAIGSKRYWTISSGTDAAFNHSKDHAMLQGMQHSSLNVVNTLTLHEGMYLQYERGGLNTRATGDVRWRRSTGAMRDFSTLSAVDYQYGLSARYTIPGTNTTISAEGTMYSRRGYGSASLNTDDFILNAYVSQPLLKGKLVARLEGFDLLHRMSQTQYEVNAQGRIETWYRSLPHYVMLHLVYNLNLNPKKR